MKVPPKRKGNMGFADFLDKFGRPSMKVPPKRKGNGGCDKAGRAVSPFPSMKVPPKRKGNARRRYRLLHALPWYLNESPSEKEGK